MIRLRRLALASDQAQIGFEIRERQLNRIPDYIHVQLKVAVGHPITHAFHLMPWNFRMRASEFVMLFKQLGGQFANDQQFHNDGILRFRVFKEISLGHSFG